MQTAELTRCQQKRRRRRRSFIEAIENASLADTSLLVDVGQRLRDMRTARNLSIRSLAEKSDLNVNTLSMIENGKTSPSVATLQQLAFALGEPITSFFETDKPERIVVFQKSIQRRKAAFAHGFLEDLGVGMAHRGAEPFLVTLEAHADSGANPIVHTGREFVFCLKGRLTYTIEDETFILEPGDSLLFEAHLPHCWQNTGDTTTSAILVLCPSDENDRPTERHFAPDSNLGVS